MTTALKRLAGPVAPSKASLGTTIYTCAADSAVVHNVTMHNTDQQRPATLTLAIGQASASGQLATWTVPPRATRVIPLGLVLSAGESLVARQTVDAATGAGALSVERVAAAAVASSTNDSSYVTTEWATEPKAAYVLTVYSYNTTQALAPAPSKVVDTHDGVSWKLLSSVLHVIKGTSPQGIRLAQYRAQAPSATTGVTEVQFPQTMHGAIMEVVVLRGADVGGSNGSQAVSPEVAVAAEAPHLSVKTLTMTSASSLGSSLAAFVGRSTSTWTLGSTGHTTLASATVENGTLLLASKLAPGSTASATANSIIVGAGMLLGLYDAATPVNVVVNGVEFS